MSNSERLIVAIVICLFAALLLIYPAQAAEPTQMPSMIEWSQAQWKQHNGTLYLRVKIGNTGWCFTRSTSSMVSKSNEWEYVAPAAVSAAIPATIEQVQVCTDALPVQLWVVATNLAATDIPPTRPLKNDAMVNKWRILVGAPCEVATISVLRAGVYEYHYATNAAGQRGITVCAKSP